MGRKIVFILLAALLAPLVEVAAQTAAPDYEERMCKAGLVDIQSLDDEIEVALKYAT